MRVCEAAAVTDFCIPSLFAVGACISPAGGEINGEQLLQTLTAYATFMCGQHTVYYHTRGFIKSVCVLCAGVAQGE